MLMTKRKKYLKKKALKKKGIFINRKKERKIYL